MAARKVAVRLVLPDHLVEGILELARRRGVEASVVVEEAIRRFLEGKARKPYGLGTLPNRWRVWSARYSQQ